MALVILSRPWSVCAKRVQYQSFTGPATLLPQIVPNNRHNPHFDLKMYTYSQQHQHTGAQSNLTEDFVDTQDEDNLHETHFNK